MEKILIHHRSSHHAQNSGYGKLMDYLEAQIIASEKKRLPYTVAKYISQQSNSKAGLYESTSVHKDWELIHYLLFAKNKDRIIHYLNGERDIRYAIQLASLFSRTKVCASFHKPPEILSATIQDTSYLKKLDAAIVVGVNQVDFIQNWLNLEHVKFIPHGVDTAFFKPDTSKRNENTLLFVGQHLRDFEALNYAIPRLKEQIPTIKINVILRSDFAHKIVSNDAVTIFSGIDDPNLRKMYQEATALFLPLINSTACNSILEAMACGLPIISTDVGGNSGYVKANSGILVPANDCKALVDETVALLKDNDKQIEMSNDARKIALDFEWEKVALAIEGFYNEIKS